MIADPGASPRVAIAALLFLAGCGAEAPSDPSLETVGPSGDEPSRQVPVTPDPPSDRSPAWLRALLAYDLEATPSDARTVALGERLDAPVTCPQPGTGCYVELELAGQTTQVHVGDDRALQVWGPIEPMQMPAWVDGVERQIDQSTLTRIDDLGSGPDRLWRDDRRVVLLHDHSGLPCGGFCPAMIWIAPPDHPSAPGYGFTDPE